MKNKTLTITYTDYIKYITAKPYGINIIFGQKGSGKTALNTVFALWEMAMRQRYLQCMSEIELLKEERVRDYSFPPQAHCVFSSPNYSIVDNWKFGKGDKSSYSYNPYHFNIPNLRIDYDIYPPFSTFHCMEAQAPLNSRQSKNFPSETSRAYENERHPNYLIWLDCQRLGLVDLNVREITDWFITPISLEHKYNSLNVMIGTTFHTLCFDSLLKAERYVETEDISLGKLVDFVFEGGCVFNCYSSFGNKKIFFETDKDFEYISSKDPNSASLLAPKNYYKG